MGFLAPAAAALGSAAVPTAAASGLGHLLGTDPSRIGQIAGGIGRAANGIASVGGAAPAYEAPVNNHMQLLDPDVIQQLIQRFGSGQQQMPLTTGSVAPLARAPGGFY